MTTLAALVAFVAAVLVLLWVFQRSFIYFPFGTVPPPIDVGLTGVETVTFDTADGIRLSGWFIGVSGDAPPPTVIVVNGNAGNRAYRAPLAQALRRRGFQVLLFDYRGYGGSAGSPSEEGRAEDARAARAYLADRPDVDASRLVYFGESLGTGVATRLAVEAPPFALVLRSPFISMADVGQFHYPFLPVRRLLRDRFDVLERIGEVRAPLLVVAGGRDRVVPAGQSRRVHDAAAEPKRLLVLPGADHNDYELLAGDELVDAVADFLEAQP